MKDKTVRRGTLALSDPKYFKIVYQKSLFHNIKKYHYAGFNSNNELVIATATDSYTLSNSVFGWVPEYNSIHFKIKTKLSYHESKLGFKIKKGTLENHTEIWLDARGLIHLHSKNSNIDDITVVFCPENPAAWTGDNK